LIFNSSRAQINAALSGYGIAYLPENLVLDDLATGRLVQVLDEWSPFFQGYYLYYPSKRQNAPAFSVVMNALRV
jgi:DNA-binding transcriptional LysR family regulator